MSAGAEIITGSQGNDNIRAKGNSDDQIFGLGGNDTIDGGAGNDTIDGGEGNDTLTGGPGNFSDTFVFGLNSGVDTVTDFQSGMDVVDLSGTGVSDLTGKVSDDANGNCVIDLGGGNSITLQGVNSATFLSNPANFVLADPPSGPVTVDMGVNDTFSDPGDGVDHVITTDLNGEADTDTDMLSFGPNNGNDTVNDFRYEDVGFDEFGIPFTIPGDSLDLSGYGIYGEDLGPSGYIAYFDTLVAQGLIDSYSVTATDTVINFTAGDSLTLLGIGESEIGIVIELNMVRDSGGSA